MLYGPSLLYPSNYYLLFSMRRSLYTSKWIRPSLGLIRSKILCIVASSVYIKNVWIKLSLPFGSFFLSGSCTLQSGEDASCVIYNRCSPFLQVSILPTFYMKLLRAQIPKVQKRLTTSLSFLRFWDQHVKELLLECWWNQLIKLFRLYINWQFDANFL